MPLSLFSQSLLDERTPTKGPWDRLEAPRVGQSPDEITQGLIEAGLTHDQVDAAMADAFEQGLPGEEVEVDLGEAALGRTTQADVRDTGAIKANTKAATATGVSDTERKVFTQLQQQATRAAAVGNIAQGAALDKANKLSAVWTDMIEKYRKK